MAKVYCRYCDWIDLRDRGTGFDSNRCYCKLKDAYVRIDEGWYCDSFEAKSGGCFLTSACVEYLGKPDDCAELTALRNFRDRYMKTTEEGRKLVEEYYAVASKIVEKINSSDKKELYYRYISLVIDKCVCLIGRNELEKTLDEYKSMVLFLKKETQI